MVQSIGNSIVWLILTWLDDRCILQLYLKIVPGVVECLQAQHEESKLLQQHFSSCISKSCLVLLDACKHNMSGCNLWRHVVAGQVCIQPQHTQTTSHKHHVHMLKLCCREDLVAISLTSTGATCLTERQPRRKAESRVYVTTSEHEIYDVSVSLPAS